MLSSAKHQSNHSLSAKNKTLTKVSSFPYTFSPSSSSSSSLITSQDSQAQETSQITMEEVWKDINLASIHHQNSIFQDFLNQEPTSLTMASSSNGDTTTTVTALFMSSSPLAPPATVLSLNPGSGFEFLDNQDPHVTLNSMVTTSTCFGKKRGQESNEDSWNTRHKRMIKNRESAARSRARKQAYTYELELEIAHLQAENKRLKRQQDQLRMVAAKQRPKKNTLQRSYTAPF